MLLVREVDILAEAPVGGALGKPVRTGLASPGAFLLPC